jgi:hypothetical protein
MTMSIQVIGRLKKAAAESAASARAKSSQLIHAAIV